MSKHDEIPDDVAYTEFTFGDVVHRVPIGPEGARRFLEGEEAIGMGRGEPAVDEDGRLIEEHRNTMEPDEGGDVDSP
jgi:hypothetical protein